MHFWSFLLGGFEYLLYFIVDPFNVIDSGFILYVFEKILPSVLLLNNGLRALSLHLLAAKRISLSPIGNFPFLISGIFSWIIVMFSPFSALTFLLPLVVLSPITFFILPGRYGFHLGDIKFKVFPFLLSQINLSIHQFTLLAIV